MPLVTATILASLVTLSMSPAVAATPRPGHVCSKVNATAKYKSKTLKCLRVKGHSHIIWAVYKKKTVTKKPAAQLTVAFVGALTPNVYYDAAACGFKTEAKLKNVKTIVNSPSTFGAAPQQAVLDSVLIQRPNGIVIGPAVGVAVADTINNAAKNNIQVSVIASPPFDANAIAFVNADIPAATQLGVDLLARLLPNGGEIGMIGLQPNSEIDAARVNGYLAALKKYPNLNLVQTEYSGVNTANASRLVSVILESHPNLKGLLVTSGTPTTGAATQLLALNMQGKIKLIGYDASPTAVQGVKDGVVQGVISQYPNKAGALALDAILDKIAGRDVPFVQNYRPYLITSDNVNTPAGQAAAYRSC
jgi:ribose transport system substrate-binding protein